MTEIPNSPVPEDQRMAALARLGELTSSVTHEFNNILNNIMLHLAVLEQKGIADELKPDLATIKKTGRKAAALVQHLQQYSQALLPPPVPVDLNEVVSAAVASPLHCELCPDLPPVLGNAADLKRVVELLTANAVAVSGRPEAVLVRTGRAAEGILLEVSDPGPPLAPEMLKRHFEPFVIVRPGGDGVRLAVCKDLVRRQHGMLHGENRDGGVVYIAELRSAENVV